ncbi:hypothetical protein CC86DRAFT_439659, partial [Ophiobolus disseminans]
GVPLVFRGSSSKGLCLPFEFHCPLFPPNPSPTRACLLSSPCLSLTARGFVVDLHHQPGRRAVALVPSSCSPSSSKRRFAARLLWQPRPTAPASCAIHSLAPKQKSRPYTHGRHERCVLCYVEICLPRDKHTTVSPCSPIASLAPASTLVHQHSRPHTCSDRPTLYLANA